jgi:hypothetical protein
MKNLFFLMLMVVAIVGNVDGQSIQDKIRFIDKAVITASTELKKAKHNLGTEKSKAMKEVKKLERKNRKSKTTGSLSVELVILIKEKVDSISRITSNKEIAQKTADLNYWKEEKLLLIKSMLGVYTNKLTADSVIAADVRSLPVEISRYHHSRRLRVNNLRRENLVLNKIEQNISSSISPSGQESGYKIIFDNMYREAVDFMVCSTDGAGRTSVMVDPGTMRTKYMLPGRYVVQFVVNGCSSGKSRVLNIDGQTSDYKGEACFGFVYMPRF